MPDGNGGYRSQDGGDFWAPTSPINLAFRLRGVPRPTNNCFYDTNNDGVVDIIDFGAFGSEFGRADCLD